MSYMVSAATMFATAFAPLTPIFPQEMQSAVSCIRNHQLHSAAGRVAFVEQRMRPLKALAIVLNAEVVAGYQRTTVTMEQAQMQQKNVEILGQMLPILIDALKLAEDFAALDTVLTKLSPLTDEDKEMLFRLERICNYVDMMDLNASFNL